MAAAQQMCDRLTAFYKQPEKFPVSWEGLSQLLMAPNNVIYVWGFVSGTDHPLGGCVGTVVWLDGDQIFVFHAGDTVGLLLRDGQAELLTSLHEINGAIHRYFGLVGPGLEIEVKQYVIEEGDKILLLTNGVTKVFHPREAALFIESALARHHHLGRAAQELAETSQGRGSTDDITVLLLEYEPGN